MNSTIDSNNYLESIKAYRKDYYLKNKDKLITSSKSYYDDNKQKCLDRMKEYREANKSILNEKKNTKCECVCGASITITNKSQHLKSKKHQNYLASKS
jgi:glutamyl/glutaminyl-tRNA synthetase